MFFTSREGGRKIRPSEAGADLPAEELEPVALAGEPVARAEEEAVVLAAQAEEPEREEESAQDAALRVEVLALHEEGEVPHVEDAVRRVEGEDDLVPALEQAEA